MNNKTTRSPEISRQQVQKLTPPLLSNRGLVSISLFWERIVFLKNIFHKKFKHPITIKNEMTKNFCLHPPPPPGIKNQNKGMEDHIGYRFPLSLPTIWGNHLPFNFMLKFPIYYLEKPLPITSKWRRVTVRKRKVEHTVSEGAFFFQKFIQNSIEREENMKWERSVFLNPIEVGLRYSISQFTHGRVNGRWQG